MQKISEWSLAKKLLASERRGVVIGLSIAAVVCLLVAVCIIKFRWLQKLGLLNCNLGTQGGASAEKCDEDGCCYTSEKDFV